MFKKTILLVLLLGASSYVFAEGLDDVRSAFRSYKDIDNISIVVPTVVELPIENTFVERQDVAVYDNESEAFQPYRLIIKNSEELTPVTASSPQAIGSPANLIDGKYTTSVEYALPADRSGEAVITLTATKPITSSNFVLLLDNFVALPNTIEIKTKDGGQDKIVFAKSRMQTQRVNFLETTASVWEITLEYGQPLRVTEAFLSQKNTTQSAQKMLRFLAQPEHTYRVYIDPDRYVSVPVGEAGNLFADDDVLVLSSVQTKENVLYKMSDLDADGIPDVLDNCVSVANADQEDINSNGRGDMCDDFDKDGIINSVDNCINDPNRNQADEDGDGIGNVCDSEESRITEKYGWLPWVGMGFVALVLFALFFITIKGMKSEKKDQNSSSDTSHNEPPSNNPPVNTSGQ